MVIEPGTTLAYKVWKLKVDVDSGVIIPMMTANQSGGFFKDSKENEFFNCFGGVLGLSKTNTDPNLYGLT